MIGPGIKGSTSTLGIPANYYIDGLGENFSGAIQNIFKKDPASGLIDRSIYFRDKASRKPTQFARHLKVLCNKKL